MRLFGILYSKHKIIKKIVNIIVKNIFASIKFRLFYATKNNLYGTLKK